MPDKSPYLIVGLGNPGDRYWETRHNIGFRVVDSLAESLSVPFGSDVLHPELSYVRVDIENRDVILAKPLSYMNRSGPPVKRLIDTYGILCEDMLVIHDDIDLAIGRLKIKEKGGSGGHKGVRSLLDALGKDIFTRLRIGIGRPENGTDIVDYVLGNFEANEMKFLEKILQLARDAALTILCHGAQDGMNRFNRKRLILNS